MTLVGDISMQQGVDQSLAKEQTAKKICAYLSVEGQEWLKNPVLKDNFLRTVKKMLSIVTGSYKLVT